MARPVTDPAYHPLVRRLVRGLRQRCGVQEGDAIAVAVSGGADSVALLRALKLLAPRRRWRLDLTVAHVQHHLRDEAEGDARFVEGLAHQLNLPFRRRDIHPTAEPGNLESAARRLRYRALAELAAETGATHVATAHHADDQLETLLMRLLRGATVSGLRGIAWKRQLQGSGVRGQESGVRGQESGVRSQGSGAEGSAVKLIRPMLAATHEEAIDFLRRIDQPWREDHTNADRSRTRARLRHEVLPVLRSLRPSVARKAVELADHARQIHQD